MKRYCISFEPFKLLRTESADEERERLGAEVGGFHFEEKPHSRCPPQTTASTNINSQPAKRNTGNFRPTQKKIVYMFLYLEHSRMI